jgi:hypothetical protein
MRSQLIAITRDVLPSILGLGEDVFNPLYAREKVPVIKSLLRFKDDIDLYQPTQVMLFPPFFFPPKVRAKPAFRESYGVLMFQSEIIFTVRYSSNYPSNIFNLYKGYESCPFWQSDGKEKGRQQAYSDTPNIRQAMEHNRCQGPPF